jgi:hypothetical protein
LAFTLGHAMQAALLAAQAQHDLDRHGDARMAAIAMRFAANGLDHLEAAGAMQPSDAAITADTPLDADALPEADW